MSERAKMVAQSLTVLFLSKEPWRGEVKLNQTSFKNLNSSFTIDMMQTCVSTKATATSLPEGVSTKKISSHIKMPVVSLSIPPLGNGNYKHGNETRIIDVCERMGLSW